MDARTLFWSGALLNMAAMVGLAVAGVRQARRGDIPRHRRSMAAAAGLVALFVVAYVGKTAVLGHEDLDAWSARDRGVLWFHESCVALMLLGGALAFQRSRSLRRTRRVTGDPSDPAPPASLLATHRLAGRAAVGGAVLGLLSAGLVLAGMLARQG